MSKNWSEKLGLIALIGGINEGDSGSCTPNRDSLKSTLLFFASFFDESRFLEKLRKGMTVPAAKYQTTVSPTLKMSDGSPSRSPFHPQPPQDDHDARERAYYDRQHNAIAVESDDLPTNLQRSGARVYPAGKSPMLASAAMDAFEDSDPEEDPSDAGDPDLAVYFGAYGLPTHSQIAICRTYANHLAARVRATRGPGKKRRTSDFEENAE